MEKNKKRKPVKPSVFERFVIYLYKVFIIKHNLKKNFGFTCKSKDQVKIDEPFVLMCNHLTDNDLYFPVLNLKNYLYFVCSEHLYRASKAMNFFIKHFHAITMYKGSVGTAAAKDIIRRVKDGNNVCIFPEGSRTFDGITNPIAKSTGGLVKACRCAMVTYKLEGGYFAAPRWSRKPRRGPIHAYIKHVYSSEELKKMSADEIQKIIEDDLYENAFERQAENPKKYVRDDKCYAEGLENFLFICPKCGGFETIRSEGDKFWCEKCDVSGTMDEYGYMVGPNAPFKTIPEWEKVENEKFDELYDSGNMHFVNDDVDLVLIHPDHTIETVYHGRIEGDYDGITAGSYRFNYLTFEASEYINLGNTFMFTYEGKHYYFVAKYLNGVKYRKMYWKVREKDCKEKGILFDISK